MTTTTEYDLTYECSFDGELGSLMSIDARGHLDDADAEVFLASIVADELPSAGYDETPTFGLEIEHLWRSEHPLDIDPDDAVDGYSERWTYHYTEEKRDDAIAVTRFQIASPWAREAVAPTAERAVRDRRTGEHVIDGVDSWPLMCIHHADEPAVSGIPEARFSNTEPGQVLDGNVHYCRPCLAAFDERMKIATEKSWAPERATEFLAVSSDAVVAESGSRQLLRADLEAVLHGRDLDGSARHRLRAFEEAHRATGAKEHRSIVTAMPGYKSLYVSDIHWLVEDYAHRSA